MIDIKLVRENRRLIEENNGSRNVKVDLDELLRLDALRVSTGQQLDALRAEVNKSSKTKMGPEEIEKNRRRGAEIKKLEESLRQASAAAKDLLIRVPNLNDDGIPLGKDESENRQKGAFGEKPVFDFKIKEHFDVAGVKELMDLPRGARCSGSRFYYLRGKLALLERALMQYAFDFTLAKGFIPVLPPIMVKEDAMYATGFFPADKSEIYAVNPGEDNLFLVGTAEVPLVYMHSDEILKAADLPLRYVGITPCFRRESGSYGKDTKGMFRVHQFYKVEMVVFAAPDQSRKLHEEMLALEEEFIRSLGLHYRVMDVCSGELGYPAARKYDCECWFPGQNRYREITSTSNTTDYQARRSNIRFADAQGKKAIVHTLNGTVASDRPMLAIIENFQTPDGRVSIPEPLRKYTGFDSI